MSPEDEHEAALICLFLMSRAEAMACRTVEELALWHTRWLGRNGITTQIIRDFGRMMRETRRA